jgi:hypothetical protein
MILTVVKKGRLTLQYLQQHESGNISFSKENNTTRVSIKVSRYSTIPEVIRCAGEILQRRYPETFHGEKKFQLY